MVRHFHEFGNHFVALEISGKETGLEGWGDTTEKSGSLFHELNGAPGGFVIMKSKGGRRNSRRKLLISVPTGGTMDSLRSGSLIVQKHQHHLRTFWKCPFSGSF